MPGVHFPHGKDGAMHANHHVRVLYSTWGKIRKDISSRERRS